MNCEYFGACGGCNFYDIPYDKQLEAKHLEQKERFFPLYQDAIEQFGSDTLAHRARAEFRIWHEDSTWSFALTHLVDKKKVVPILRCVKLLPSIQTMMQRLQQHLHSKTLTHKLFGIEFLATQQQEMIITLLYHKRLDEQWRQEATALAQITQAEIIGRARKERIVIGKDYITERLHMQQPQQRTLQYIQFENGFTQPNPSTNEKMLDWTVQQLKQIECRDLLELYCGLGNFTIVLAPFFNQVLATEVSKVSIAALKENAALNDVSNILVARMSADEVIQACNKERPFNRLRHVDLEQLQLTTLFVDPPRAGLSLNVINLAKQTDNIIYISCNPETLFRDVTLLHETHTISAMALFDQFAYTHHVEMGAILKKRDV